MPTSDRYFVDTPVQGSHAVLTGPEAHHLIHVMRSGPGARVVLFDGTGMEFSAQVEQIGRTEVQLAVLSRHEVDRELPIDITIAVSLPKGDRQKWLVEKATELGVRRIVPLKTARAVAQPVEQALVRLQRAVVEASKQCGRNRLMEITEPLLWADFVSSTEEAPCRLLAHPESRSNGVKTTTGPTWREDLGSGSAVLAIGPEGGFAAEEVSLAIAANWQPVDLGPRILRIETAAVFLAAMVIYAGQADERAACDRIVSQD